MKIFRAIAASIGVLALFVSVPLLAQNAIYVFPPTPRTPVGGVQSLTAVVTGNANKTVNWSSTCGTLVGSGNTIGVQSSSAGACTVTATMAADGVTAASSVVTFEPVRPDLQAAGIHPRIGLTAADVTDLQTKAANAGNIAYTVGLAPNFSGTQTYYNSVFCWTGGGCGAVGPIGTIDPDTGWIDGNDSFNGVSGGAFEINTALYALMALIDPTVGNRSTWAAHAHDMSMWEMNEICYNAYSGSGACVARSGTLTPFIGVQFALNNRAQGAVPPQLQAIDWNYSSFSSADKALIAQVGHIWGQEASYGDSVAATDEYVLPTGAYNTSTIISGNVPQGEWGANNYSLEHFMLLSYLGLLLDPADDPAVSSCAPTTTTICSTDGTAQTVGAYGVSAVKGWLYRLNSLFEDQHIVDAEYGLSDPFICPDIQIGNTTCTGRMSGGQSSEGTGYAQVSMPEMFKGMYALYTAGKLNPSTDPQASFISSSFWDKMVLSLVAQLYNVGSSSYSPGGYYIPFSSDSQLNGYMFQIPLFNVMEVYDAKYGSTWRKDIEKWYTYNAQDASYSYYGYYFIQGAKSGPLWAANVMQATSATNDGDLVSGTGNPTSFGLYDPRSSSILPLDFENLSSNGGFYRYYGRNSWSNAATQFQFGCSTSTINHSSPACGRIDYVRNGEALSIGLNGTENNDTYAQAPSHQNTPGYQYNPSFDCSVDGGVILGICSEGGIMDNSWAASSNTVLATSSNSTYYYGAVDSSNGYIFYDNGGDATATQNVTLAQREVLWLKPDQTWVYDRTAQTLGTGFQKFNLDLETEPTISGNLATMTSSGGQTLYVTSLLPGISALTTSALYKDGEGEENSPMNYLLVDTATPAATNRMLHTLEGKDSGGAASATALVQSISGNGMDCGTVSTTLACFMRTRGSFTGTTYPASGATTQYITGLAANTAYTISGAGAPTSATTDTAGVLTFSASGTGTIKVTVGTVGTSNAPSLQSIAVTPSTVVLQALGNQQYTAACTYSDGSTANCTSSATWASSSMGVVTVNNAGMATGVAQGNASIIATSGSIQGQAAVTVPAATLQKVTVTPGSLTVPVGSAQQFKATGTYSDSSTTDVTSQVTWSSSNPAVVASNSAGLASTMSQGNASIIAASGNVQGQAAVTVSAAVAAPNFSPTAGTYSSAQTVSISTTTPSATIHYTTNGATPTTSSPVYSGPITVSASETVEAIAVASGGSASSASSAAYTITPPTATPAFSPAGGTYSSAQTVSISTTTPSAKIYYTTNGATPTTSSPVYSGPITVSASETVEAIAVASGGSASSASSAAYTITPPTATPAFSPAGGTYSSAQTVSISTTTPSAMIYYTTNGATPTTSSPVYSGPITVSASETLGAIAVASGGSASSASSAAYTITPPTATPAFSPAGGTYSSAQTVSISTTTPSATIYYTTNGATPTTSSPVYSGPITVSASETVEAIAVASGGSASSASSAAYTITPPTATPAFSPAGGTYSSAQTVSISTTTPSATIYYTTNGATPTTSSPVYSGPITVSASETVEAIAVASGGSASSASSAAYTITPPTATPAFSPAGGTYSSAQTVSISTTTPSATIYYTTNGATPTTTSPVYSGPITVSASETVEAIAVASGGSASSASSAAYTITPPTATPAFSPAGGTYSSAQTVSISTTTPSAKIYYTTNGATPTASSPVYSGPITVTANETINTIAVAAGYKTSAMGSASYTVNLPQAATPALSPATGTYSSAQTVTISTTTPSATIYYTTNGSTPTTSSAVYSGPITVSASETVEAIAVATGDSTSVVGSADYTINPVPGAPTFSPAGGTYVSAQTVTIQTTLASATIYYTTNGSTPTTSSPIYSGSITVAASETIHAIAVAVDNANAFDKARGRKTATATYLASTAGSATYTIDLAAPTFAVTILPAALTVTAKQSGTVTVLVAPQNGFASSVSFSCSGLPAGTSCSFAPATVTPSGAVASTTLTIAVSTAAAALSRNSSPFFPSSALAVVLCCFGWKKRRGLNLLSVAIAAGLGLGLCTGCGVEPIFPLPTTSTVSVIAASGSVQPAAFLTLTVQ